MTWAQLTWRTPVRDEVNLLSVYDGTPRGVVRSGAELWHRLNGRRVSYTRIDMDEGERERIMGLLRLLQRR